MKKFILLLVLNSPFLLVPFFSGILNSSAQSPDFLWAKSIGGTSYDGALSVAIDVSGNVYTTGNFSDTVDFDPGPGVFNLDTGVIFISKLDNTGNFLWAKAIGGSGTVNSAGTSIILDVSGYVYITGKFMGTVDFDPGTGVFNLTSTGGSNLDIFITKLDASGNFVWAKQMGGAVNDVGLSIAIDLSGNVYTTGEFSGTADFDPGAGSFNLTGGKAIFISKLDSSGNFVWAKGIISSGGSAEIQNPSFALDASGNVYTTGFFRGTVDFDPDVGTFNLTSAGVWDIFISKLDASGNFIWTKAMGASGAYAHGNSIAIDSAGISNVYITGDFSGTVDFDPSAATFNLTTGSTLNSDIFISKLDSSGNFIWANQIGGTTGNFSYCIAVDPSGRGEIYTTGLSTGTADFDPGTGVFNLTSAGDADIFVSKLDSSGNFVWAKEMGGIERDAGAAIALNTSGNVFITGGFESPSISFGNTTLVNANTSGSTNDIFIAKLDTALVTGNNEIKYFGNEINVYPNPALNTTTISFSLFQSENVSLKIFDANGRLVSTLTDKIFEPGENKIEFNAEKLDAGIYFLIMQLAETLQAKKLIVAK